MGVREFLTPFNKNNPPFIISDGFPSHFLPKPLSAEFQLDDPKMRKEVKKVEFVSIKEFNLFSKGIGSKPLVPSKQFTAHLTMHNTINRLTNSTVGGGVFGIREVFIPEISFLIKTTSVEWKNRLVEMLQVLAKSGYGKKKSVGRGHFKLDEVKEFKFDPINSPDGFVSLSNFCPAEDDPSEGLYKTFVKYGKLGEEFTFCGNPFKKPLVMMKAGSVFRTGGTPKEYYGRMIQEGIAPAKPEVVQYAYAFAVPIVYPTTCGL